MLLKDTYPTIFESNLMKVNFGQIVTEKSGTIQTGKTVVAQSLKRESVMLDRDGNVIDPRTKRVIKLAEL